jgi:hypothetical protein
MRVRSLKVRAAYIKLKCRRLMLLGAQQFCGSDKNFLPSNRANIQARLVALGLMTGKRIRPKYARGNQKIPAIQWISGAFGGDLRAHCRL